MFADLPPHYSATCLSCMCFHSVESKEAASDVLTESTIMLCFNNTRAAPRFLTVLQQPSSLFLVVRLEIFVSLCCISDLPMTCERNRCMTEIYFWCFSSSGQYFLCLIKYVFWLAWHS